MTPRLWPRSIVIPTSPLSRTEFWIAVTMLAFVGIIIAWVNSFDLPLDDQEAYVVEGAREMSLRGDWVVPYFNGAPRLAKPPLNYWLTGCVSWLSNAGADILPWHGRLASMLAGIGCAVLVSLLGLRLYEWKIGILAGLMYVASNGFFAYSIDARPDMVYAFLCFAGFSALCFARGGGAGDKQAMFWSYGAWTAFGFATLANGPHLPFALLLSFVVFLLLAGASRRSILDLLRPVSGLLIFAAITLPWWVMVKRRVGGAGLEDAEIAGAINTLSIEHLLSLYYLYRPLELVFPWVVFLPVTVWYVKKYVRRDERCLLLVCAWFVPVVLLSLGPQARWFYMLPVLPVGVLLMAASVIEYAGLETRSSSTMFRALFLALELIILSAAVWLLSHTDNWISQSLSLVAMGLTVVHLCLTGLRIKAASMRLKRLVFLGGCVGVVYLAVAFSKVAWSNDRYERAKLGAFIGANINSSVELVAWNINPGVLIYYGKRTIPSVRGVDEIDVRLARSGDGGLAIVTDGTKLKFLQDSYGFELLAKAPAPRQKDQLIVVFARRKPGRDRLPGT